MADSDSLFYLKNQFYLRAYQSVARNPPPQKDSPEYLPSLLYSARSLIALNQSDEALLLVSADTLPAVRAVRALATYVKTKASGGEVEPILDELRDLTIEIESEDEGVQGAGTSVVRVSAATAFLQEGEVEEALTTLGAGAGGQDMECSYLTIQIYLSMNRIDLARKEYLYAKSHDADSLLLQIIEASIGLASGGTPPLTLNAAYHIYDEQAAAPGSSSNANILAAKGIAYLLRGHYAEAGSMFNESLLIDAKNSDALAGLAVTKGLSTKQKDADESFEHLISVLPSHPFVADLVAKSALFDQARTQFAPSVPSSGK
ncbi:coatomer epsilon subunit-domain-containing protein [Cantharellus anzutake]|uniref:coatomer epsilon subunit-domain-containing protein n=1 Tax=Cantharellus anzutake TaxID=1750568 RepID=UPI001905BEA1|nr:coatomer epsilon subunit-domain-containing protein [Cantharellus anzutake]KAF8308786.1 coatomer epsilon subunit-domain-containing protein [Cantharellus anzutake]